MGHPTPRSCHPTLCGALFSGGGQAHQSMSPAINSGGLGAAPPNCYHRPMKNPASAVGSASGRAADSSRAGTVPHPATLRDAGGDGAGCVAAAAVPPVSRVSESVRATPTRHVVTGPFGRQPRHALAGCGQRVVAQTTGESAAGSIQLRGQRCVAVVRFQTASRAEPVLSEAEG